MLRFRWLRIRGGLGTEATLSEVLSTMTTLKFSWEGSRAEAQRYRVRYETPRVGSFLLHRLGALVAFLPL